MKKLILFFLIVFFSELTVIHAQFDDNTDEYSEEESSEEQAEVVALLTVDEEETSLPEAEIKQIEDPQAILLSNLISVLGRSRAEVVMRLLNEISTNISVGSGTTAQNEVTFRKNWVDKLTKAEELFYNIFINRGVPYTLYYSTGIQKSNINYQSEVIELHTIINLRMNDDWKNILDHTHQILKKLDTALQATGKRREWGLNDWPNVGVTKTNPFMNRFSGGGFSGTTRHGTPWENNFSITFELLNNNNRVIGKQTVNLSPYYEFFCSNRDFYGNFIEYNGSVSHVTFGDPNRAIELIYEADNILTMSFNNVKISDVSDKMTLRVFSVNGVRPDKTELRIIPLTEAEWNEKGWREREEARYYFR